MLISDDNTRWRILAWITSLVLFIEKEKTIPPLEERAGVNTSCAVVVILGETCKVEFSFRNSILLAAVHSQPILSGKWRFFWVGPGLLGLCVASPIQTAPYYGPGFCRRELGTILWLTCSVLHVNESNQWILRRSQTSKNLRIIVQLLINFPWQRSNCYILLT